MALYARTTDHVIIKSRTRSMHWPKGQTMAQRYATGQRRPRSVECMERLSLASIGSRVERYRPPEAMIGSPCFRHFSRDESGRAAKSGNVRNRMAARYHVTANGLHGLAKPYRVDPASRDQREISSPPFLILAKNLPAGSLTVQRVPRRLRTAFFLIRTFVAEGEDPLLLANPRPCRPQSSRRDTRRLQTIPPDCAP